MAWNPLGTFVPDGNWTRIDQPLQSRLIRVQYLGDAAWLEKYNPRLYFRLWIDGQGHTANWATLWPKDGEQEIFTLNSPPFSDQYLEFRKQKGFSSLSANYQIEIDESLEFELISSSSSDNSDNSGNNGLTATYFQNINFTSPVVTRLDSEINFDFANSAPAAGLPNDNYSIRWEGVISVPVSGNYKFYFPRSTPCNMYLNGGQVWTKSSENATGEEEITYYMNAGTMTFRLDAWDDTNSQGLFVLRWLVPNDSTPVVIPSSAFTPLP